MKKTFDAMEMKRRGAERIYQIVKDMTPEEQLVFWQERDKEFRQLQEDIRANRVSPALAIPPAPEAEWASVETEAS